MLLPYSFLVYFRMNEYLATPSFFLSFNQSYLLRLPIFKLQLPFFNLRFPFFNSRFLIFILRFLFFNLQFPTFIFSITNLYFPILTFWADYWQKIFSKIHQKNPTNASKKSMLNYYGHVNKYHKVKREG